MKLLEEFHRRRGNEPLRRVIATALILKAAEVVWFIGDAVQSFASRVDDVGGSVREVGHRLLDAWAEHCDGPTPPADVAEFAARADRALREVELSRPLRERLALLDVAELQHLYLGLTAMAESGALRGSPILTTMRIEVIAAFEKEFGRDPDAARVRLDCPDPLARFHFSDPITFHFGPTEFSSTGNGA